MIAVLDMDSASPIRFLSRVSLPVRISFSVSGAATSSFAAAPCIGYCSNASRIALLDAQSRLDSCYVIGSSVASYAVFAFVVLENEQLWFHLAGDWTPFLVRGSDPRRSFWEEESVFSETCLATITTGHDPDASR